MDVAQAFIADIIEKPFFKYSTFFFVSKENAPIEIATNVFRPYLIPKQPKRCYGIALQNKAKKKNCFLVEQLDII